MSKQTREKKYKSKNIVAKRIELNRNTDGDILDHLENVDNFQGYIKKLIREKISEKN